MSASGPGTRARVSGAIKTPTGEDGLDGKVYRRSPRDFGTVSSARLVLPYFLVAIAVNGSIMALRCTEQNQGIDAQVIVSRLINEAMELPINIMIVDAVGEACRVMLAPAGVRSSDRPRNGNGNRRFQSISSWY